MEPNERPAIHPDFIRAGMLPGRGADPLAAAKRVDEGDDFESNLGAVVGKAGALAIEVNERRALALLVTEFVRRKHAKRMLPSAGDAAIAFQIADLLSQIAGCAPSSLDAAFTDTEELLSKGPPVNTDVDRALRG